MHHSEGQTILEVRNMNTIFPGKHAVKDFSLSICAGEIIGIVGATGSGKSVAAKSFLKLLATEVAEVSFDNVVYLDNNSIEGLRATDIALVFQDSNLALNPVQKCGVQIQKVLRKHLGVDKVSAKTMTIDLLKKVEIRDPDRIFLSYPHQVSGGELQRVMIAMGLSCNPKLLILDEPASSLDKIVQHRIVSLLQKLQEDQGLAIIVISHDIEMISILADRIIHISDGAIVANQSAEKFFTKPESDVSREMIAQIRAFRLGSYQEMLSGSVLLNVRDLGKRFTDGQWAFRNVTFSLEAHESLGIIGESGSGKSSLAKSIAGIMQVSEGELHCPESNTQITYVFQDVYSSMDPELTVKEILYEVVRLQKAKGSSPEFLLKQVLLEPELLQRKIHQLSGGQRQRVNLARALATDPKILICDEVTSGLDLQVQFEIIELLRSKLTEMAIIFISHDISLVKYFTHNIIIMKEGKVENQGNTKEIFENVLPGYTYDLINSVKEVKYFLNT